jgi:hypothetical protein
LEETLKLQREWLFNIRMLVDHIQRGIAADTD